MLAEVLYYLANSCTTRLWPRAKSHHCCMYGICMYITCAPSTLWYIWTRMFSWLLSYTYTSPTQTMSQVLAPPACNTQINIALGLDVPEIQSQKIGLICSPSPNDPYTDRRASEPLQTECKPFELLLFSHIALFGTARFRSFIISSG